MSFILVPFVRLDPRTFLTVSALEVHPSTFGFIIITLIVVRCRRIHVPAVAHFMLFRVVDMLSLKKNCIIIRNMKNKIAFNRVFLMVSR